MLSKGSRGDVMSTSIFIATRWRSVGLDVLVRQAVLSVSSVGPGGDLHPPRRGALLNSNFEDSVTKFCDRTVRVDLRRQLQLPLESCQCDIVLIGVALARYSRNGSFLGSHEQLGPDDLHAHGLRR